MNWKEKLKEELWMFEVSTMEQTRIEHFIESLLEEQRKEQRNKVLGEVRNEVEKVPTDYKSEAQLCVKDYKENISTIISKLKLK